METSAFSPSVTGLGEAGLLGFKSLSLRLCGTSRCERSLPVFRSTQMVKSLLPSNPVMKMRSRPGTGDEWPAGKAVFQITFRSGPNSTGKCVVLDMDVPFGPRHCDQSLANDWPMQKHAIR